MVDTEILRIFAPAIEGTALVPKGGHNRRPQRDKNDGRRRSSMKTQNRGRKRGLPGSCDFLRTLNTEQSMINYSIVMRSVNANLLEINQAKSRINQAKKDGKEPDKKDTDLVKTESLPSTSLLTAACIQEPTSAPSSTWQ